MRTRLLRVTLIGIGVLFCLCGPMLVLPASCLRAITACFPGSENLDALWPVKPMYDYTLRTALVAYVWIGAGLLLAAADPDRHRSQINVAIGGLLLLSVVCLTAGPLNGVPPWWYLGDGVLSMIGAILLLVLRPRAGAKQGNREGALGD